MATINGLNIVALTDHNSAKNCPAFFEAAKRYGIIAVAGMELTTSEDIHIVCLFEEIDDAMRFDKYVDENRIKVKNRPHIFGHQVVLDGLDEPVCEVEDLLINATNISVEDVCRIVSEFNGICYPAHIDRDSNGIIAVLGTLPDCGFTLYELHDGERIDEFSEKYQIPRDRFIISSDAHYLADMREGEFYFEIDDENYSSSLVRHRLFEHLRRFEV